MLLYTSFIEGRLFTLRYLFFLYQKTFLYEIISWRWLSFIMLVCTSVPFVYLNVLWIIEGTKACGWEMNEVHRYRRWTGSALNTGVMFSFGGSIFWVYCGTLVFCSLGARWAYTGGLSLRLLMLQGKSLLKYKHPKWVCYQTLVLPNLCF